MPPLRTVTLDKPMKTERTHEENQERAYIAASRRSDRSLEARIESARRASEIHKRRTGRSLRVTEADVINEEMYEEEDDDLPMQYRRLTAHLQTNSTDFNRRLAAYLTSQMAMRAALDQAVMNTYGSQSAAAAAYLQNQQAVQQSNYSTNGVNSPQSPTSPVSYQHFPYPISATKFNTNTTDQQPTSTTEQNQSSPPHPAESVSLKQATVEADSESSNNTRMSMLSAEESKHPDQQAFGSSRDIGPLTTSLPPESLRLLTNPLDLTNPMTAHYLSGSDKIRQSLSSFHSPSAFSNMSQFHHTYDGMSQTLAPCALDTNTDQADFLSPTSADSEEHLPLHESTYNYEFDSFDPDNAANMISDSPGEHGREMLGDKDWAQYIDTSWE